MITLRSSMRSGSQTNGDRASTDAHDDRDIGLDLDRIIWDPEYRREIIDRLGSTGSEPGAADRPG